MPRSNWKGYISFGLVNIPIVLYNAEDASQKVSFHQIDKRNHARIKYQRINAETGKEVPWEAVGRGYEYTKDIIFELGDDELKKIAGENARTIAIESFVDADSIHFINVEKTYYLIPDKRGEKGYIILKEALMKTKKIGIAKVIISTKEYLAAVSIYEDVLVLYLLHYNDEIRPLSEFKVPESNLKKYHISTKEIDIAKQLVLSMSKPWHPEKYKDEYKVVVTKWAEKKAKKMPLPTMAPRAHASKNERVINFVDLLKKSLVKNKSKKPLKKLTPAKTKSAAARHAVKH